MIFKDYYKILGLDNNKVSIDEIKIAYREQAKKVSSRCKYRKQKRRRKI